MELESEPPVFTKWFDFVKWLLPGRLDKTTRRSHMKRVGYLFEKVIAFENLYRAAMKAFRGKKEKNNVARFHFDLEKELLIREEELKMGTYRPSPYGTFSIFEPKERKICCSILRDRVVHHAICNVMEPIFERRFIYDTYACRKSKGTHSALRRAQEFTRRIGGGDPLFP